LIAYPEPIYQEPVIPVYEQVIPVYEPRPFEYEHSEMTYIPGEKPMHDDSRPKDKKS